MKSLRLFLLSTLCAILCAMTVFAQTGTFATAYDLYSYWNEQRYTVPETTSPYPDYVCGVWSTDGSMENLTFAVTKDEAGEAGKAEILELVEDDATVSFAYQTYPYAELWAIQQELTDSLGDETGAWGIGVYETENAVGIHIDMDHPGSEAFMLECFETYGDRVRFEDGSGAVLTAESSGVILPGTGTLKSAGPLNTQLWLWTLTAILALLCVAVWKVRIPLLQTIGGSLVTVKSSVSRKDIVEEIRRNIAAPPPEVCQSILQKISEPSEND